MDSTSYIIQELNKLSNTSASFISKAGEGLNISFKAKIKLVKKLQADQNASSNEFDSFSDQILPFYDKVSKTISNIEYYYKGNDSKGVNQVIDSFKKVNQVISDEVIKTVEAEKLTNSDTVELAEILVYSLNSKKIPPIFSSFQNNLDHFINSGLSLQKKIVEDYCISIRNTIDSGNRIMEETNFLINFYISENGAFLHGVEPTVRAANNLIELLNLFN